MTKWTPPWQRHTRRKIIWDWLHSREYAQQQVWWCIACELANYGPAVLSGYIREIEHLTPTKLQNVRRLRHVLNLARRFVGPEERGRRDLE